MKVTRLPVHPGPAGWNRLLLAACCVAAVVAALFLRADRGAGGQPRGAVEADRPLTALTRHGVDFAAEAAAEYRLSAEAFARSGKVNAAATEMGHQHNLDYAAHLGELHELRDADQMRAMMGSAYDRSGLFTPVGWPRPDGPRHRAEGHFSGERASRQLWGYQRQLMHVFTFASMTRVVSEGEMARLGSAGARSFFVVPRGDGWDDGAMPILITLGLVALYFVWAIWGRKTAQNEASARLDPLWSKLTKRKACKWSATGDSTGRFVEYRCSACGVSAMSHTGKPPQDCKRNLTSGL